MDYSKLKKQELLEELKKAQETLEVISGDLKSKDESVILLSEERSELLEKVQTWKDTCDSIMAEKDSLKSKNKELEEKLTFSKGDLERVQSLESAEYTSLKYYKLSVLLESIILIILSILHFI